MEQFEDSWTSFIQQIWNSVGAGRGAVPCFFFRILLTSSIEGAAVPNGLVGRGASEIPALSGSGLLRRASVYVLVRQASNFAWLTVRVPDFGGSSKDLPHRYGSLKNFCLARLLSYVFCLAFSAFRRMLIFLFTSFHRSERPTFPTSPDLFHWLRRAFFSFFNFLSSSCRPVYYYCYYYY